MEKKISGESFIARSEPFFVDIAALLSNQAGVDLFRISMSQNVICYKVSEVSINLRLRLVLIPFKNGQMLGRLSWLDRRGIDHVCCYVNEVFDCLDIASGGVWKKQTNNIGSLCLKQFESLVA
ncbi:hypothetical protein M3I01_003235 [Marinomonas sp. RSW2]|uniref:PilZ domain-containing protein n=1 Tax=Marinomonas maritima TaxID=2940935 RepID=A0ABT5WAW0_9GAMM|nr:hypothetical protein [Marinomonas maritima]MDE8601939.1 hypothetical protein [Marinomonas maritima]